MRPDTDDTIAAPPAACASTDRGRQPGREPARLLTAAGTALAGISGIARRGGLGATAALAAITAARKLAAGLEHGELAFIEAARSGGATWSQIAAAMGTGNRQTAQKRHADLARRCPCPPSVDMPAPPESRPQETGHDDRPASTLVAGAGNFPAPARTGRPEPDRGKDRPLSPAVPAPAAAAPPAPPARSPRKQPLPEITSAIIAESQYELVRAPGHHETRAWHVLVGGTRAGLVRPTWRGERSRPGWEPVDNTGLALPATGIGRVTPAGNARTRDAAAVSLLRALQRQQENEHKGKRPR
ncbi:MAG TPA: hypothetical protein VMV17_05340 [Streptosporangiaceae bacterium]|nr:hypothetical protein [Streptosporangiaceae bacterium]